MRFRQPPEALTESPVENQTDPITCWRTRVPNESVHDCLENYTFLTPCVEIKKANLYGVPAEQFWGGFLTLLP